MSGQGVSTVILELQTNSSPCHSRCNIALTLLLLCLWPVASSHADTTRTDVMTQPDRHDDLKINEWGIWGQDLQSEQWQTESPLASEFGVGINGSEEMELNLLDDSNLIDDASGVKPEDELDLELQKLPEGF